MINPLTMQGQKLSLMQDANLALTQRIIELEEALKPARQARSARKSEAFCGEQHQLAEKDVTADLADITRQLRELLPQSHPPKAKSVRDS